MLSALALCRAALPTTLRHTYLHQLATMTPSVMSSARPTRRKITPTEPRALFVSVVFRWIYGFSLLLVFADVAPTSKQSNNYGSNYGSNYNSDPCSTLPCGLGFSCLNLQGGQYTCLATSSADGDSQGTTTVSPGSNELSSVHVAVIAGLLTLVMHDHAVSHDPSLRSRLRVPCCCRRWCCDDATTQAAV